MVYWSGSNVEGRFTLEKRGSEGDTVRERKGGGTKGVSERDVTL